MMGSHALYITMYDFASYITVIIRCIRVPATEQFQLRAREHTVMAMKRSWVQDGFWSDQSARLPTLTHRL